MFAGGFLARARVRMGFSVSPRISTCWIPPLANGVEFSSLKCVGWCAGWLRRVTLLALHQLTCRRLDNEHSLTILGCAARAVDSIYIYIRRLLAPPDSVVERTEPLPIVYAPSFSNAACPARMGERGAVAAATWRTNAILEAARLCPG